MSTYSKLPLSASINGQHILITGTTSGSGTPIHTAVSGESSLDEIWLYACNDSTASLVLSINWGNLIEPTNVVRSSLAAQSGRTLIVDGELLQNSLLVSAYASVGGFISINGFINRIQ